MPRYRKLHVKTLESLDMNDMPDDFTRLMWVLLPLSLCREGRGIHHPAWLKSKLFPLRFDVTEEMVTESFDWLISRRMVETYNVSGRDYFRVPSFHRYQGNTIKEAESNYPPPDDELQTNSGPTPEPVQTKSASDANASSNADANANAASSTSGIDADTGCKLLVDYGVDEAVAKELASQPLARIEAGIARAKAREKRLDNPQGFLVSELKSGVLLRPPPSPEPEYQRFLAGGYDEFIER